MMKQAWEKIGLDWRIAACLGLCAAAQGVQAAETGGGNAVGGPSRIERVTLYPGAAAVERVARVAAGARRLELACLPAAFDPQSLRVAASEGIRVGAVRIDTVARDAAPQCARSVRESRARELEEQIAGLDAEIRANELAAVYLQKVGEQGGVHAADKPPPAPDAGGLARASSALVRSGQEIFARQNELRRRKEELERQFAAVRQNPGSAMLRTVSVALAAERAGEVRVSYQIARAGWEPAYQADLDPDSGKLTLLRQAVVAQASGEDWRGVRLRLSTGQPHAAPQGPSPDPWELGIRRPGPREYAAAMPAAPAPMMLRKAEPMAASAGDEAADAPLFDVAVADQAFSTEFEVPGTADVEADGQKIVLTLASHEFPATVTVRSTPGLDRAAWLVAAIARPEGVWPAGRVQLRRGGAFAGVTGWPAAEEGRISLPFGRDEQITVTLEQTANFTRETGFTGSDNERETGAAYTFHNQHRFPVRLEVLEASPVSTAEEIRVETRFSPEPAQKRWRNLPGVVAWEQTLEAGQSTRLTASYLIRYPRDAQITGLR